MEIIMISDRCPFSGDFLPLSVRAGSRNTNTRTTNLPFYLLHLEQISHHLLDPNSSGRMVPQKEQGVG